MTILSCGIDFHKNTVNYHIINKEQELIEKGRKKTTSIIAYLSKFDNLHIAIEASGGVNDFVDRLKASGHRVTIINPKKFRLVGVNGLKNDDKDAEALAIGLSSGFAPTVHHKQKRSREIKSLLVSREIAVNTRVNIFNHIRGTLREQGLTILKGKEAFLNNVSETINKVENTYIRNTLFDLLNTGRSLMKQEDEITNRLLLFTQNDERINRLQTMPGIGPMTALALIAVIDDIGRFPDAQSFASYLGLVPRESSSGDKRRMGAITKSGSELLRRYLIHGSRSIMMRLKPDDRDTNKQWALRLKNRVGMNKATVALAHRMSRIAFYMLRDSTAYGEIAEGRADAAKNFSQEAA